MKIVFIAGSYFGDGTREIIEKNVREAEKYQIALANARIGFFCAHNHTEHFSSGEKADAPEEFYHELDMHFLKNISDAVLAIPGWKKSKGAQKEIKWAQQNNLLIFHPKAPSDIGDIIKWAKE